MTPAPNANAHAAGSERRAAGDLVSRLAASMTRQAATLSTADGRYITGGIAEFEGTPADWRARLTQLDQPGQVASMYFAEGVRDVILRLEDGRRARARITGTSFLATAKRICDVTGVDRLT